MGKFALKVDAHDFLPPNSFETLWREIRKFGEAPVDRAVGSSWKLVVIDNIDSIPSAAQFAMRKLMEAAPKLKFVLVVCDKMKIAASVLEKVSVLVSALRCLWRGYDFSVCADVCTYHRRIMWSLRARVSEMRCWWWRPYCMRTR